MNKNALPMASNLIAMASNLIIAMASNLIIAMASNLIIAMASNLINSDCLQPTRWLWLFVVNL